MIGRPDLYKRLRASFYVARSLLSTSHPRKKYPFPPPQYYPPQVPFSQWIDNSLAVKQGLQELFNFKKQNPDANLAPFLDKSSQYFRDYIERGLEKIEVELGNGGGMGSATSNGGGKVCIFMHR